MSVREMQVKRERRCHVFYIVYRKFSAVTKYYKVYNVFIT